MSFKTQEAYYKTVVERFTQLWATTGHQDSLSDALTSLAIANTNTDRRAPIDSTSANEIQWVQKNNELSVILLAMRKIREAIVASSRFDTFALKAYMFIVRATILTKHIDSYHPALVYLLQKLHPRSPMTASEEHEFVGYYILDLACRQSDLAAAYDICNGYRYEDERLSMLLHALAHDNWCVFWEIRSQVDDYQKRLVELGDDRMRKIALNCLGKSYLSAEKAYVEKMTGRSWEQLKKQDKVTWGLDGDTVIIRPIKKA